MDCPFNILACLCLGSVWAAPSVSPCWEQVAGVAGLWAGEDDPPAESTAPPENTFWDRSVSATDLVHIANCWSAAGITGPMRQAALWGAAACDRINALTETRGLWTYFQNCTVSKNRMPGVLSMSVFFSFVLCESYEWPEEIKSISRNPREKSKERKVWKNKLVWQNLFFCSLYPDNHQIYLSVSTPRLETTDL